jgi:hypothetical protein
MKKIEVRENDVIDLQTGEAIGSFTVFTGLTLRENLRGHGRPFTAWVQLDSANASIPCRYLNPAGGGWQQGKICLSIVFVPDQPEPIQDGASQSVVEEELNS